MTSNIGSQHADIADGVEREKLIREELRKYFRIEFLNRIDDIVVYDTLSEGEIVQIVELMLATVKKRLIEQDIRVEWDDALLHRIAKLGYDPAMGARPLKRAITEYIVNPLSEKILLGEIREGMELQITLDETDHLVVSSK